MTRKDVAKIVNKAKGIRLDVGAGNNCQEGFVGMDKRDLPGIEIVHDVECFPWPLPDECCLMIVCSHLYEHIKPWLSIDFMNELWRILRVGSQLALSMPYGVNDNYLQDPTHINPSNFNTFHYFCPGNPLYGIYSPSPWEMCAGFPQYRINGNMEILLVKILVEEGDDDTT